MAFVLATTGSWFRCAAGCGKTSTIADAKVVTDTRRLALCTDCFFLCGAVPQVMVVDLAAGHQSGPTTEREHRKMTLRW